MEMTQELVDRVVARLFPVDQIPRVHDILARYGRPGIDRELIRVRLAALRVSGGSVPELEKAVTAALVDYRDVLSWAEYPVELVNPTWEMPAADVTRIRTSDRSQYQEWLARFGALPGDPPP